MNDLDAYVRIAELVITGIAALGIFYVSYRLQGMREWFRREMRAAIKESCADKVRFEAHVEKDEAYQVASRELLDEKFENVKTQVAAVAGRVEHLTQMLDQRH